MSETHLYFAFGANMSEEVALRRRNIRPLTREVAVLAKHRLVFDAAGVPLLEPAFASVRADEASDVWGVLYELTDHDMARLRRYEGRAYVTSEMRVTGSVRGDTNALLFQTRYPTEGLRPSRRYRDALVRGAREQGLPSAYIEALIHVDALYVPGISEVSQAAFATAEALHQRGLSITNLLDWGRAKARAKSQ